MCVSWASAVAPILAKWQSQEWVSLGITIPVHLGTPFYNKGVHVVVDWIKWVWATGVWCVETASYCHLCYCWRRGDGRLHGKSWAEVSSPDRKQEVSWVDSVVCWREAAQHTRPSWTRMITAAFNLPLFLAVLTDRVFSTVFSALSSCMHVCGNLYFSRKMLYIIINKIIEHKIV